MAILRTELAVRYAATAVALAAILSSCAGKEVKKPPPYDLTLAVAAMQASDFGEAVHLWTNVLAVDTLTPEQRAEAYRGRGVAHFRLHEVTLALADVQDGIAVKADSTQLLILRGLLYLEKREPAKARADFDAVLKIKPDDAAAHAGRARTDLQDGQFDPAITEMDIAIAAKPYEAGFYAERGRADLLAGKRDAAIADFDQAVGHAPSDAEAYKLRGMALYETGRFPGALADLQHSLTLKTDQPYTVIWVHMAHIRMKDADQAELLRNLDNLNEKQWPLPIVAFFQGKLTADQVAALAVSDNADGERSRTCEAAFYTAQIPVTAKNANDIRRQLLRAEETCPADFVERGMARVELGGM